MIQIFLFKSTALAHTTVKLPEVIFWFKFCYKLAFSLFYVRFEPYEEKDI
jgi:hypothetical protein